MTELLWRHHFFLTDNDVVMVFPPSPLPSIRLYASAKTFFQSTTKVGKDFEIQDAEILTDDWLRPKLLK